jgi:FkbM family methyltransferase
MMDRGKIGSQGQSPPVRGPLKAEKVHGEPKSGLKVATPAVPSAISQIKAALASALPPSVTLRLLAAKHYFNGEPELRQLARLMDPQKESIDVGAHHGVYTYFLARHSQWVHCYEPYPRDAKFLAEAFAGRNATIYPCALSDQEGAAELHVPRGPGSETGGQPSLLPPRAGSLPETRLAVETRRLDQMGHENVGFIKVDVEGHERAVVAGAAKLLDDQRPLLLVEVHGYAEDDPARLLREIQAPDYTGWFYSAGRWTPIERFRSGLHARMEDAGARGLCFRRNFLFVPRERLLNFGGFAK